MKKPNSFLTTPVAVILGSILISIAILVNGGIIKVGKLNTQVQAPQPQGQQAPAPQPTSAKVSIDDDPILGDKNAPVTLIEFSDYECPFCKRHFDQVYPQIKKDYIDTGKVKMVFRDYPLSFHDPMATYEAGAANCAREQGGDSAYFKFHDAIFTKTTSNGNGLTKEQIFQMAQDLGLNQANLKSCAEASKYSEEIKKDFSEGSSIGVSGTPSFVVGKSTPDGTVEGKLIVGAQPYSEFQSTIDSLLK